MSAASFNESGSTPQPKPANPQSRLTAVLVLSVYIFEFACTLAGRHAMPGWYEPAIKPKYALHDWMFNILWLVLFVPAAIFAVNFVPFGKIKPLAVGLFYGFILTPALAAWGLFVTPQPLVTGSVLLLSLVWATLLVLQVPKEAKTWALFATLPLLLWNGYSFLLAQSLVRLAQKHH